MGFETDWVDKTVLTFQSYGGDYYFTFYNEIQTNASSIDIFRLYNETTAEVYSLMEAHDNYWDTNGGCKRATLPAGLTTVKIQFKGSGNKSTSIRRARIGVQKL